MDAAGRRHVCDRCRRPKGQMSHQGRGQVRSCSRSASSRTISSRPVVRSPSSFRSRRMRPTTSRTLPDVGCQLLLGQPGDHAAVGVERRDVQQVSDHVLVQRRERGAGERVDVGGHPFGQVAQQDPGDLGITVRDRHHVLAPQQQDPAVGDGLLADVGQGSGIQRRNPVDVAGTGVADGQLPPLDGHQEGPDQPLDHDGREVRAADRHERPPGGHVDEHGALDQGRLDVARKLPQTTEG